MTQCDAVTVDDVLMLHWCKHYTVKAVQVVEIVRDFSHLEKWQDATIISDVMKRVKIRICWMRIFTFKICRMWMRIQIVAFIL